MPAFFVPPVPLIRSKLILRKLRESGAFCEQSAVTLAQAGVFRPEAFPAVTEHLVRKGLLRSAGGGRYYLAEPGAAPAREERK